MSQDVSGFGVRVTLVSIPTFPAGITITQFSNDADPVDMASVKFADIAMGVNGDLISWSRAVALPMVLNVIPGSDDDINLQILADANRASQNKLSSNDTIQATVVYPNGSVVQLISGRITDAMFGRGISSDGRQKTKSYAFSFQDKIGA